MQQGYRPNLKRIWPLAIKLNSLESLKLFEKLKFGKSNASDATEWFQEATAVQRHPDPSPINSDNTVTTRERMLT